MTAISCASCAQPGDKAMAQQFEAMLPSIEKVAGYAFRHVPRRNRQELISDVVVLAFTAFARLAERGKLALAYPTVLAWYAVKQRRDGREVGVRQTSEDALSRRAQWRKGFIAELMTDCRNASGWEELADDKRSTPPEIVEARLDFRTWLSRLQESKRQVALRLARGDSTSDAARYFRVSRARISQLRQELKSDWEQFQNSTAAA